MWNTDLHPNQFSLHLSFGLLGILSIICVSAGAQTNQEVEQAAAIADHSYNLGLELENSGRIEEAFEAYEQAVREDASHAKALNKLGTIYEAKGDASDAEFYYREAFIQEPSFYLPRVNLSRLMKKSNRVEAAARILKEVLEADPSFFEARLELSAILVDQKLFTLALPLLKAGLALHEDEPHLNLQIGKLYVMSGEPGKSIPFLEAAANGKEEKLVSSLDLKSIIIEANWIPTRMFEAGKNPEKMNHYLNKVLEIDPSNQIARLFATEKALASRREEEARKHLEVLLKLPPEDQPTPESLIAALPFPEGVIMLADIYRRTRRKEVGRGILEEALTFANKSGNRIWRTQIQNEMYRY